MNVIRICKFYLLKIKRHQGSPHSLAGGIAVGVLVGLTPTMPFHTILIGLICLITRTSVVVGVAVGWIVCNPLTCLPIYYLAALAGNYLTPYELQLSKVKLVVEQLRAGASFIDMFALIAQAGGEAVVVMLIGGFSIGVPAGVVTYYVCLPIIIGMRHKRLAKQML